MSLFFFQESHVLAPYKILFFYCLHDEASLLESGVQTPLSFVSLQGNNDFNFVAAVTWVNYRSFLDHCHFDGFHTGADAKTAPPFEHDEPLNSCGPEDQSQGYGCALVHLSGCCSSLPRALSLPWLWRCREQEEEG